MALDHDIVIAGGGLVGAACACALAGKGLRIAVIDALGPPADAAPEPKRVSALTLAARRLLERVGAWPHVPEAALCAFEHMHVWEPGGGSIHFDAADLGVSELGVIAENDALRGALWRILQRHRTVELLFPQRVAAVDIATDVVTVSLDNGRRLTARLLIGADGADSRVRELAGIAATVRPYGQDALVCTVRTEAHHRWTAWQCFLPDGPLAFLPLADGRSSIVWSAPPEQNAARIDMEDAAFREALAEAFEFRLGAVLEASARKTFPLRRIRAERTVADRIALIGDAAHTIHVLAGQGVNLGLLDAAALAEVVHAAHANGRDIGALPVLRRYERWRKGENLLMMAAMDALDGLFRSRAAPVRCARSTGLSLTDACAPAKRFIMRRAVGLSGDLPAAARPAPFHEHG